MAIIVKSQTQESEDARIRWVESLAYITEPEMIREVKSALDDIGQCLEDDPRAASLIAALKDTYEAWRRRDADFQRAT